VSAAKARKSAKVVVLESAPGRIGESAECCDAAIQQQSQAKGRRNKDRSSGVHLPEYLIPKKGGI